MMSKASALLLLAGSLAAAAAATADPPLNVTLCRKIQVPGPTEIDACCTTAQNQTKGGATCCNTTSSAWELPSVVCLEVEPATDAPYLSLDTGMYGRFKLLGRMEPAIISLQYYRARLEQRIEFDPECLKGPSKMCPAYEDAWEELNATVCCF